MRCNKHELIALASQTSQNFDREGILVLKEKPDGFFRRTEGYSMKWFRLRGNLLFYLKGPEPWCEPMGVIVLGNHQVTVHNQDECGHWPFQIVWDNGATHRLATLFEPDRNMWLRAIQTAPYNAVSAELLALQEKLNKIRLVVDIAQYRMQNKIVTDMNEVPLCELAVSCDNLLCDALGRAPSSRVVVYVRLAKGVCVKYGATEVVENCSNPCFSRTVVFRASDGLCGEAVVRIAVCDTRERVSDTSAPIGYTAMPLATIQEAQRLRVCLQSRDHKTVGFITLNGWCLEPAGAGASPVHVPPPEPDRAQLHRTLCHRRSQSLPPRLGMKLRLPSHDAMVRHNFTNTHHVTYRFHSGLGGDIAVHELMAESKICYELPMQLLDVFISRERELIEMLVSGGEMAGEWRARQLELISSHATQLTHYCMSRLAMQQQPTPHLKPSPSKDQAHLEFAPINLHLQRMWACNDTLNKSGFHDVITVGAFAAHTPKADRSGGLIRLVQQMKDVSSAKAALHSAAATRIQAEFDKMSALNRAADELFRDLNSAIVAMQAKKEDDVRAKIAVVESTTRSMMALWDPVSVEQSLSYVGWPTEAHNNYNPQQQMLSTLSGMFDEVNPFGMGFECDSYSSPHPEGLAPSPSSSQDTSPVEDQPTLSASVPNICPDQPKPDLHFQNDYFNDRHDRNNHSFRSVKAVRMDGQSLSFDAHKHRAGSLRHDFKSSTSLGQVSYRSLMNNLGMSDEKLSKMRRDPISLVNVVMQDAATRRANLERLRTTGREAEDAVHTAISAIKEALEQDTELSEYDLDDISSDVDEVRVRWRDVVRWLRVSHAALRLRCEPPQWTRAHVALQTRRDACFSQALTTVTSGLICWLCTTPSDIVVRLLSSGLGPLCGFEGLLSLHQAEKAMWGDMVVAVEDLHTVVFSIVTSGPNHDTTARVGGMRGAVTVHIPVPDSLYDNFPNKEHTSFTITAVFFNIGINEKATLAEALGETTPQHHSNGDNLDRLYKYYHKYGTLFQRRLAAARASSRSMPLEEVMENLRIAVHKKRPKNTEVLQLAARVTTLMNGVRFTSCKSAKDRTGMSVTLEQCAVLAAEYQLAANEMPRALAVMRSEGCRRENALKNIGVKKYAFTKKQVMNLPEGYRPPPGTYGSSQT